MGTYSQQLIVDGSIAVMLAISLGIIYGHAGFLSLCHATFFGVGAYAAAGFSAIYVTYYGSASICMSILAAVIASMLFAVIVGLMCLYLRGDFIALATLGIGELARALALNIEGLGGAKGIRNIEALTTPALALSLAIIAIFAARFFLQSPWGRMMEAGRDNPSWADSLAIPRRKAQFSALLFGAAIAGAAGALFAHHQQYIHPNSFDLMASITILLAVILGGKGNLTGCIIGALIVSLFPELLRLSLPSSADWRVLGIGILLLFTAIIWPHGILGRWPYLDPVRRVLQWLRNHSQGTRTEGFPLLKVSTLSVHGLNVKASSATILKDVNLSIDSGVPTALIGPNGSGKSTLGRAIAGDIPSSGLITLDSKRFERYPRLIDEKQLILCTTQHPTGFRNLSALDNVRVVADRFLKGSPWLSWLPLISEWHNASSRKTALRALSWLGLGDRPDIPFKDMSYGQRKRVILATALFSSPRVLILDEPFAGLNLQPGGDADVVINALKDRLSSEDDITIIIDHRIDILQDLCKRAMLIDDGQIVREGSFEEIIELPYFKEDYCNERIRGQES